MLNHFDVFVSAADRRCLITRNICEIRGRVDAPQSLTGAAADVRVDDAQAALRLVLTPRILRFWAPRMSDGVYNLLMR